MRPAGRWRAVVAAAALLALVIAACGGDGSGGDEGPRAPAESSEPVALHIGAVLPETGSLAFLGVPIIAAVRLAVEDVNAQGGEVTLTLADSATNPAAGLEGARRLLGEGAHVVVGAGASSVSQAFVQTLFDEQIPQCSPSNTSPVFTAQENAAYYFRTIPPDTAMAPVIADVVVSRGATRIAIIGRADAWGNALESLLAAEFDRLGAETLSVLYDPETASYSAEVAAVVNYEPDMVINLGFSSDGSETVRQLLESGIGPERQLAATGALQDDAVGVGRRLQPVRARWDAGHLADGEGQRGLQGAAQGRGRRLPGLRPPRATTASSCWPWRPASLGTPATARR